MTEAGQAFSGSIPEIYNRHLGPFLFEPYALDLAQRLAGFRGRLLETAAGTGILTRALARSLPPDSAIVATDISQPMLDFATRMPSPPNVTWQQADALSLPFEDAGFDAVVCQFGVMFFPDKPAGFAEAGRVLKPGGRFLFNVWDRIEESELAKIVSDAVAACFPDDPPGFLARTPWGYHDKDWIRNDLNAAGFTHIDIETVALHGRAPSPADPAIGLCQGSPLRGEIEARDPNRLNEVTVTATAAVSRHFGAGPLDSRLQAHVITATA